MSSKIVGPISGFSNSEIRTRYGLKSEILFPVQLFFNIHCNACNIGSNGLIKQRLVINDKYVPYFDEKYFRVLLKVRIVGLGI